MFETTCGVCTDLAWLFFEMAVRDEELFSLLVVVFTGNWCFETLFLEPVDTYCIFLGLWACRCHRVQKQTCRVVTVPCFLFQCTRRSKIFAWVLIGTFFFQKVTYIAVFQPHGAGIFYCWLRSGDLKLVFKLLNTIFLGLLTLWQNLLLGLHL